MQIQRENSRRKPAQITKAAIIVTITSMSSRSFIKQTLTGRFDRSTLERDDCARVFTLNQSLSRPS